MSTSPDDETDITTAFEDLRREVSLVRAALEGLTSAREQAREHMPDYRPTLEDVAHNVAVLADKVARMDQRPALQLTPAQMVAELNKASEGALLEALSDQRGRADLARRAG
jgi:hypothetical protein